MAATEDAVTEDADARAVEDDRAARVAPAAIEGLRWHGDRCVGIVTWVGVAERGFGICAFAGAGPGARVDKYFAQLAEMPGARSGDVVTFEAGEGPGVSRLWRLGRAEPQDGEQRLAALVADRGQDSITLQVCHGSATHTLPWDGQGLDGTRSGAFVTFSVEGGRACRPEFARQSLCLGQGTCAICYDDKLVTSAAPCTDPGHAFCLPCLQTYILALKGDQAAYPIRCPGGACVPMHLDGIPRSIVTVGDYAVLERRDKIAALGPELAAVCESCGHVSYASVNRPNGAGRCEKCRTTFCRNCGLCDQRHLRTSCEAYRQEHRGEDTNTRRLIESTSKPCPQCGFRVSHFHGHACHHIAPGRGCPNCGTHWCYVCGQRKDEANPACPSHGSTFCKTADILANLVAEPYPHDRRCGCPVCNLCRPGQPCAQCSGNCIVCCGIVPPGPDTLEAERQDWAAAAGA